MRNRRSVRSWIVVRENPHTTRKEVIQMKKREGLKLWMYVIIMAVVVMGMSLLLSQVPAQAAVDCNLVTSNNTTDTDGDGFTDYQECVGITLYDGSRFKGRNDKGTLPRSQYLDPDSKDLFVVLVRAGSTLIPPKPTNAEDVAYWFEYVSNIADQITGFGLGLGVHLIGAGQVDGQRTVCPSCAKPTGQLVKQRAVKITESLVVPNPTDNILGFTSQSGTPDGLDGTTVYTQKIYNLLSGQPQAIKDLYIKHTIAHEIGHTVGPLAPVNDKNYGANHYQSANNNLIMDQSVYQSGSTVYVGTQYKDLDQGRIRLK